MKAAKVLSIAMAAMLVLSLLPAGYAMPPVKKFKDRYKIAKANYLKALEAYKSARQDYLKIRAKAKRKPRGMTFEKAKGFLLSSIDAMIAHLQMVKARVDIAMSLSKEQKAEITEKLDGYIAYLQEKRQEAEQAENREQLVSVARDVREKWQEVRVEVRKIAGRIIISRLDRLLERAGEIGDRLEVRIETLKEMGYDTSALEELLADYREHLSLAEEKKELAEQKFDEISSPQDARKLFREANALLRESHREVRKMFADLKKIVRELRKSEVRAKGFGSLVAKGNGSAVINGTGGVFIRGNGTLTVKVANGTVRVYGEGGKQVNEDGSTTYTGFGRAKVVGRDIYLSVNGGNLLIRAVGKGTALLSGTGEWRTVRFGGAWNGEVTYGGAQNES